MNDVILRQFENCLDIASIIERLLSRSLELTGTVLGNVQLMDWRAGFLTIEAQRGFKQNFLDTFRSVRARDGSVCARATRDRSSVIVEDVLADHEFAPFRDIADDAGFRAVQSTPLITSHGAFLGVVSTHFASLHRPTDIEVRSVQIAATRAADAIIKLRALQTRNRAQSRAVDQARISASHDAIMSSLRLLRRTSVNKAP